MTGEVQLGQSRHHEVDHPVKEKLDPKYFAAWRNELTARWA